MKRLFAIFAILIFFLAPAFCQESIKINNLIFDDSDKIIYIETSGEMDESITFNKGYLKNPDRIYLDINNAILTTPKKSYTGKNAIFNSVKISQFTTEPKTVRLVFEYNNKLDLSSFKIFKTKNSLFILTDKNLVDSSYLKTVYSNSKTSERKIFFEGAKYFKEEFIQPMDLIQLENIPKNEITSELKTEEIYLKIPSKYYINSVSNTKNGIMISGLGKLSLIPSFSLQNPERLIIDLDDTVVDSTFRNKTFPIGEIQTTGEPPVIEKRETLKIGQNSQNIARIVIQGENAKNYRAIVSPDSKNLYITDKANIIGAKMSDNNAVLLTSEYLNTKDVETISLSFDDSVAFNVFEENSNLYLDINNLAPYQNSAIEPLIKAIPSIQILRLALDKLRIVFPNTSQKYISLKTSPDNDLIKIFTKNMPKEETKPKQILPQTALKTDKLPKISNVYTVVIDAGHGGSDVGATRNNIFEKDITLKIAKMVEKNLNKKDVKTFMVREKDKTVSLAERSDFSNEKRPDLFVSIHVNSSLNDNIKGIETHYWKQDSKRYAEYVHEELAKNIKKWNTVDRGLFKSQFYVINHTESPAILCEIGFISNRSERDEIIKQKRQEEIADAIANGIYNYLKAKK